LKATKKLSLKRERLTELSSDELAGIAGGAEVGVTIQIRTYTLTCGCTNGCVSDDTRCATYTCTCGCTYQWVC
jgi:natural product precursor